MTQTHTVADFIYLIRCYLLDENKDHPKSEAAYGKVLDLYLKDHNLNAGEIAEQWYLRSLLVKWVEANWHQETAKLINGFLIRKED
jgi:hypothetical protein